MEETAIDAWLVVWLEVLIMRATIAVLLFITFDGTRLCMQTFWEKGPARATLYLRSKHRIHKKLIYVELQT